HNVHDYQVWQMLPHLFQSLYAVLCFDHLVTFKLKIHADEANHSWFVINHKNEARLWALQGGGYFFNHVYFFHLVTNKSNDLFHFGGWQHLYIIDTVPGHDDARNILCQEM